MRNDGGCWPGHSPIRIVALSHCRAEDGAAVWIEKNRQLQKELDWAKEMADRLDRHNQALSRGTCRLAWVHVLASLITTAAEQAKANIDHV